MDDSSPNSGIYPVNNWKINQGITSDRVLPFSENIGSFSEDDRLINSSRMTNRSDFSNDQSGFPDQEEFDLLPSTSKANLMRNRIYSGVATGGDYPISIFSIGKTTTDHVIVLDLDETCVHSFMNIDDYRQLKIQKYPDLRQRSYFLNLNDVVTPHGQGEQTQMWGIRRPHIEEFLIFCFSYFRVVIVWSAGKYKYVHAIVNDLFRNIVPPHLTLTWDDCIKVDGICDKDLSKIYNHPELREYARPENTFILDDRTESFEMSSPENGVLIPAYKPDLTLGSLRSDDIALLQFQMWLQNPEVIQSKDVRQLNKKEIFRKSLRQLNKSLPKNNWSGSDFLDDSSYPSSSTNLPINADLLNLRPKLISIKT